MTAKEREAASLFGGLGGTSSTKPRRRARKIKGADGSSTNPKPKSKPKGRKQEVQQQQPLQQEDLTPHPNNNVSDKELSDDYFVKMSQRFNDSTGDQTHSITNRLSRAQPTSPKHHENEFNSNNSGTGGMPNINSRSNMVQQQSPPIEDIVAQMNLFFGGLGTKQNENEDDAKQGQDILGDLLGDINIDKDKDESGPFIVYNNNGIIITFYVISSQEECVCRIKAVFENRNDFDITQFEFMVAVPKYIKFQLNQLMELFYMVQARI